MDILEPIFTFVGVLLSSGLVVAAANAVFKSWQQKKLTRQDAHTAAVDLEEYARKCEEKIYKYHNAEPPPPGYEERPLIELVPEVPDLPNNPGFLYWKRAGVVEKLLQLPLLAKRKNWEAKEIWHHTDDVEHVTNFLLEAIEEMKVESLAIAEELRERFKVQGTE